jgi:hypothetical protein
VGAWRTIHAYREALNPLNCKAKQSKETVAYKANLVRNCRGIADRNQLMPPSTHQYNTRCSLQPQVYEQLLYVTDGSIPNHKAAPCLTQKAAPGILSEPGLPGHHRKVAYEGPTARDAVGPFFFPTGTWVLYHVWGESARLYDYYSKSIDERSPRGRLGGFWVRPPSQSRQAQWATE